MRLGHRAVLILGFIGLVAGALPAAAADFTVKITNSGGTNFQPANLSITVGDRVRWQNLAGVQHTSTSGVGCEADGLWDTGFMNANTTSAYVTFGTVGTFDYFCVNHCLFNMVGSITVGPKPVPVKTTSWGAIKAFYRTGE